MSSIKQRLQGAALPLAGGLRVKDVRIGLSYTAVLLENGQAGLAYTFPKDHSEGCTAFKGELPLAGSRASRLLAFFDSGAKLDSSLALATCNALFSTTVEGLREGDVLKYLDLRNEDTVGMVGWFAPVVPFLRKRVGSLKIFEQVETNDKEIMSSEEAYRILPECHVALITSTSIINGTIDGLLEAAGSCREVVLLGASTPLAPAAFSHTPVTVLAGVVISEPVEILRIVSEGCGTHRFKNAVRKVNAMLK
jgi:uncharacterized protein (DUF4213/DUF364 family)